MLSIVLTTGCHVICPQNFGVTLESQDHLKECLSKQLSHIAMHHFLEEDGSCLAALSVVERALPFVGVQNRFDVPCLESLEI